MMKKRIAIQLFGHLRTFKHTFSSFKRNVLDSNNTDYEIDIFIHTWDELEHSTVNYRQSDSSKKHAKLADSVIKKVEELYRPKEFLIEAQLDCEELILNERMGGFKRSIKGCLNMSYTLFKANQIRQDYERENNISYDWVIVTRADIYFISKFSLNSILEAYSRFDFEIPKDALFHAYNPFGRKNMIEEPQFMTGTDLIYFASPEIVNKANSLYEDFENNIDKNNFYCMEVWWGDFWRKQAINPYSINFKDGKDFRPLRTKKLKTKLLSLRVKEFLKKIKNKK